MEPSAWSRGWYDRGSAAPGGGVGEGDRTSFYHYLPRTGEIYVKLRDLMKLRDLRDAKRLISKAPGI